MAKPTNSEVKLKPSHVVPDAYLPPALRDGALRVAVLRGDAKLPTADEELERVKLLCDPIGQIIAAANGQPFVSFHVKGDEVVAEYHTRTVDQRFALLRWLGERSVPKMSTQRPARRKEGGDEDGWAATLDNAATRADS